MVNLSMVSKESGSESESGVGSTRQSQGRYTPYYADLPPYPTRSKDMFRHEKA